MRKVGLFLLLAILVVFSIYALSYSQVPNAASFAYRGDVNESGKIDIFDLLSILKILANPTSQSERTLQIADVNESGKVDIFDLLGLLKLLSGAETPKRIIFGPSIIELIPPGVVSGDTIGIVYANFNGSTSKENTTLLFNEVAAEILEVKPDTFIVIVPSVTGGNVKAVNFSDTTNALAFYIVQRLGIVSVEEVFAALSSASDLSSMKTAVRKALASVGCIVLDSCYSVLTETRQGVVLTDDMVENIATQQLEGRTTVVEELYNTLLALGITLQKADGSYVGADLFAQSLEASAYLAIIQGQANTPANNFSKLSTLRAWPVSSAPDITAEYELTPLQVSMVLLAFSEFLYSSSEGTVSVAVNLAADGNSYQGMATTLLSNLFYGGQVSSINAVGTPAAALGAGYAASGTSEYLGQNVRSWIDDLKAKNVDPQDNIMSSGELTGGNLAEKTAEKVISVVEKNPGAFQVSKSSSQISVGTGGTIGITSVPNTDPEVTITGIAGNKGNITIHFTVTDPDGSNNNLCFYYWCGGTEKQAHLKNASAGTPSAPYNQSAFVLKDVPPGNHTVIWESDYYYNMPNAQDDSIRVVIYLGDQTSRGPRLASSPVISVNNVEVQIPVLIEHTAAGQAMLGNSNFGGVVFNFSGPENKSAVTDNRGKLSVTLKAGKYLVSVEKSGYTFSPSSFYATIDEENEILPTVYATKQATTGRFVDLGNGIIQDNQLSLLWQKENPNTKVEWVDAKTYADTLRLGGYTGWRLPTIDEIYSLYDSEYVNHVHPIFIISDLSFFWSSTSRVSGINTQYQLVDFKAGNTNRYLNQTLDKAYLRVVRAPASQGEPRLLILNRSLQFDTEAGKARQQTLTLTNSGSLTLTVTGFQFSANSEYFSIDTQAPFSLNPGQSKNITITFSSSGEVRDLQSVLSIVVDYTSETFPVSITATSISTIFKTYAIQGKVLENGSGLGDVGVRITGSGVNTTLMTDSEGNYRFTGLIEGSYTVTPVTVLYIFNPDSLVITIINSDVTAQAINATASKPLPSQGNKIVIQGVTMVYIPAGSFVMGQNENSNNTYEEECLVICRPEHTVTVGGFWMGRTEITQGQFQAVMGFNPSEFKGDDNKPVERVFRSEMITFCNKLSELAGLEPCYDPGSGRCDFTKNGFRLPTEAEWEYACRAGTTTRFYTGDTESDLARAGWYRELGGAIGSTFPVAQKEPNAFGLYDMHGNVLECCNDWFQGNYYYYSTSNNPKGPGFGGSSVTRGGCYGNIEWLATSALRQALSWTMRSTFVGFRVVCGDWDAPSPTYYSLQGKVTLNNAGLEGVSLHITGYEVDTTVATGPDGRYLLSGLINDTYTLNFSKDGYLFNPSVKIIIMDGADVQVDDITATPCVINTEVIQGIAMVSIPAGSCQMGTDHPYLTYSSIPLPSPETGTLPMPVHNVSVKAFQMGKYEITQAQYQAVMGYNPSHIVGDNLPVWYVSWFDAVTFCNKLSEAAGLEPCYNLDTWESDFTKNGFRLPTEEEWEYACRAGTTTEFNTGWSEADLNRAAWYIGNSGDKIHPVGGKEPNAFGLHDMHGNVCEWCNDEYSTTERLFRGGHSLLSEGYRECISARRGKFNQGQGYFWMGFRVVRRP